MLKKIEFEGTNFGNESEGVKISSWISISKFEIQTSLHQQKSESLKMKS